MFPWVEKIKKQGAAAIDSDRVETTLAPKIFIHYLSFNERSKSPPAMKAGKGLISSNISLKTGFYQPLN